MAEQDNSILNSLAKGAGIAAIGMVFSKFIGYFYRAIVARWLGPEAYGQLSLGLMAVGIATTISVLSLGKALERYIPEYRSKDDWASIKGAVLSAIHLTVPVSILIGLGMYLSAGFISQNVFHTPELVPIIQVFAVVPFFSNLTGIFLSTVIGYKKIEYVVITDKFVHNIVQLAATVALILLGLEILSAVIGWVIGVMVGTFVAYYFMEKKIGPILGTDVKPDYHRKKLLNFSGPLIFSGIIGMFLGWSDTFFIGYFMNSKAVGFYNAALPTAMLILLPHQAFNRFALPYLTEIKEENEEQLGQNFKTLTRWTFSLTFPMFIVMALFSEQALHILFGSEYRAAALALTILSFGQLYVSFTGHLRPLIQSYSETNLLLKNSIIQLAVNTVLNLSLIPLYGILGAAIATTLSLLFGNTLLVFEAYYLKGITAFSKDLVKPILASIPGLVIVYYGLSYLFDVVPLWALFPSALLFGVLYLAFFIMIKGILKEDRRLIIGLGEKIEQENKARAIADLLIREE